MAIDERHAVTTELGVMINTAEVLITVCVHYCTTWWPGITGRQLPRARISPVMLSLVLRMRSQPKSPGAHGFPHI